MVVFPNSKINLGLRIVRKREDGYHDLETVFYPLPLNDALEIIKTSNDTVEFHQTGLSIDGDANNNLCIKAYHLLKKDFPQLPGIQMHLHKNIPMGAGLGGGSSDGAFTLLLLNEKFQLNIPKERLLDYALQLGSDCPFFIANTPAFATGRGEFLQSIPLDLSDYSWMIVHPPVHVSTAKAFSLIKPSAATLSVKDIVSTPVINWKENLINDFEIPIYQQYQELKTIKEKLYAAGAVYASMSGSGSAFYGIFKKNQLPQRIFSAENYREIHL